MTVNVTHDLVKDSREDRNATVDFLLNVARGKIDNAFAINKFGKNADIDLAADEDIISIGGDLDLTQLGGTATTVTVTSASGNDVLTGSGAETVILYGLDANYALQQVEIDLNATPPVTTETWRFLYRAEVIASNNGANDALNAGIITFARTGGNDVMEIAAGINKTQHAAYMIPAGYEGFLYNVHVHFLSSGAAAVGTPEMWVKPFGLPWLLKNPGVIATGEGDEHTYQVPCKIEEKTIVKLRMGTDQNNSVVTGTFDLILLPKFS